MDTTKIIKEITHRIAEGTKTEKIILFGSYASNKPGLDSDIDLLIVKDSKLRRDERDREIRKFLKGIVFPMDIFVYTKEEVDKHKNLTGSFINKIFKTGKILYERK